jgi:hypothetical protein
VSSLHPICSYKSRGTAMWSSMSWFS